MVWILKIDDYLQLQYATNLYQWIARTSSYCWENQQIDKFHDRLTIHPLAVLRKYKIFSGLWLYDACLCLLADV